MKSLVLTIIGPDRPGLVESLAQTVASHDGNWMESRMAHLGGKFAGILRVAVPPAKVGPLNEALKALESHELTVVTEPDTSEQLDQRFGLFTLELVGNDHPGIVRDVSHALAGRGVNVEEFNTQCEAAPMSGGQLFRATAQLRLPPGLNAEDLRVELEKVADDLMVDVTLKGD